MPGPRSLAAFVSVVARYVTFALSAISAQAWKTRPAVKSTAAREVPHASLSMWVRGNAKDGKSAVSAIVPLPHVRFRASIEAGFTGSCSSCFHICLPTFLRWEAIPFIHAFSG